MSKVLLTYPIVLPGVLLLELLISRYSLEPPKDMPAEQVKEWTKNEFLPTQLR